MSFSGDLLLHSPLVRHAKRVAGGTGYDFRPMFARIRSTVSRADLAICHLETPVAPPGEAPSTFPLYGVPAQVATAIKWAGYDRCSTASNHAMDRGVKGIDATVNALTRAGVAQTGMARRAAEAVAPVFTVKGVRVTHLSYTYGFNGIRLPRNEPWRSNRYDPDRVIREARNARARGAEYVVVSIHWGTERVAAPNSQQVSGAKAIMASKAVDLIVGHHAHVLQPIASVNQRWVVYGMGNLLSNMPTGSTWPAASQDADLVNITVTERASGGFITAKPVVHPTWCDRRNGWVIRLVQADLANPNVPTSIKTSLRASLARTRKVLGGYVPR